MNLYRKLVLHVKSHLDYKQEQKGVFFSVTMPATI